MRESQNIRWCTGRFDWLSGRTSLSVAIFQSNGIGRFSSVCLEGMSTSQKFVQTIVQMYHCCCCWCWRWLVFFGTRTNTYEVKWKFKSKSKCIIDVNLLFPAPDFNGKSTYLPSTFIQFFNLNNQSASIVLFWRRKILYKSNSNKFPFFLCCTSFII